MKLNPRQLAVGAAVALASVAGFGAITAASADDNGPKTEHQTPSTRDDNSKQKSDHNCPKDHKKSGSESESESESNA